MIFCSAGGCLVVSQPDADRSCNPPCSQPHSYCSEVCAHSLKWTSLLQQLSPTVSGTMPPLPRIATIEGWNHSLWSTFFFKLCEQLSLHSFYLPLEWRGTVSWVGWVKVAKADVACRQSSWKCFLMLLFWICLVILC